MSAAVDSPGPDGKVVRAAAGDAAAPETAAPSEHAARPGLLLRAADIETMRQAPLYVDWSRTLGGAAVAADTAQAGAKDDFAALVDAGLLNEIFEDFLEVTGLPIAVIDLGGRVLASSRWQRICMEFHRVNKLSLAGCLKSDTVLSGQMQEGSDCAIYRCANGLTDCATPIVIDGVHVANLFIGQFLLAAPDVDYFKQLQAACGFDESAYFAALAEVPIVSEQKIPAVLRLLRGLAQQITRQSLAERRALSALIDVEHQVAERTQKLKESEDRFRTAFEGAPVGQVLIDPDSLRILECNQAAADIHGYSREEFCSLRVSDFEAARDERAIQAERQRLLTEGQAHFETRARRRNGELRDIDVTLVLLRSADGNKIHATHVDITEKKRAEREQQRLNRALRLLSDCNMSLVQVADEGALLADVCRLVVETGGYLMAWIGIPEQDDAKTIRPVAQSGYEDGYLESIHVSWDEARDTGRGPTGTAVRTGLAQSNQNCLTNPKMAPWRDAAVKRGYQASIGLPLICREQTLGVLTLYAAEPDAFNADEVKLLEELARNVAFGIQTLRTRNQREAAEAASQAKSAFLANMSHEIRTPLHVITGLGHLLRHDLVDPAQQERVDQICATSEHLLAVVNDVLDLSKIEAQRLTLDHSDFTLDTVVDKVVRMVEARAREKGLRLMTGVASRLRTMPLHGDPMRLAQVLINLCGNAVKFTDEGTVCLDIACTAGDAASVTLRFAVEDTGIGIAPDQQSRLFDAFEQADGSTTRERGGTGLGLAISRRLVALMGGTLEVSSRLGKGSTFSFELVLPRADASVPAAPARTGVPAATAFHGRRVLLAEDHPLSQEILFEMLEDLGCEVEVAANGVEAIDCAQARGYDLILMDMQMPKMDGLAATRVIRALPQHRDTPIVALTANAFAEDRQRCLDAGMDGHLGKPVTPASLAAALGQWLPDVAAPGDEQPLGDDPLSLALADIPGLDVAPPWRRSPERLANYRAQLCRFVQQHGQDMGRLRQHLAAGDYGAARSVAHRLNGIAGIIGARRIAALTAEMMPALGPGADHADIIALAGACEAELDNLAQATRTLPSAG